MRTPALAGLLLLAVPAAAQTIYTWEDADGVHYTDDFNQVPKDKQVETEQLARSTTRPGTQAALTVLPAQPLPVVKESAAAEVAGRTEREWRERFIEAHRRIRTLEQSIAAGRAALPPRTDCLAQPVAYPTRTTTTTRPASAGGTPSTVTVTTMDHAPRVRCTVNPEHDRMVAQLAQQEVALRDAQLDLEQLDRRASYDAVPREWRRGW